MAIEHELTRIAARQHGLASREQLLDLGFTGPQIINRVNRGIWKRAAPRVYDVAPEAVDLSRPLHAAVLSSGGWASHRSAAWLQGLIEAPPPVPEIVVGSERTPKRLASIVHRSTYLSRGERTTMHGITCTRALRTLLDIASVVDEETLEDAVARGISRDRTSARQLLKYVDGSFAGRPGGAALRAAAAAYVNRTEATRSRLEVIVNRLIRDRAIPAPVRQHEVTMKKKTFFLDFAWPDALLFVEADGFRHHSTPLRLRRDGRRQNLLALADWMPLRYTWADAREDADEVAAEIREAMAIRNRRRSRR